MNIRILNKRISKLANGALTIALVLLVGSQASAQNFKLAVLKYNGGGDWYANLTTSVPNLIQFCNKELKTGIDTDQEVVEVGSKDLFKSWKCDLF